MIRRNDPRGALPAAGHRRDAPDALTHDIVSAHHRRRLDLDEDTGRKQ